MVRVIGQTGRTGMTLIIPVIIGNPDEKKKRSKEFVYIGSVFIQVMPIEISNSTIILTLISVARISPLNVDLKIGCPYHNDNSMQFEQTAANSACSR